MVERGEDDPSRSHLGDLGPTALSADRSGGQGRRTGSKGPCTVLLAAYVWN